jgi:hypothetical protein
LFVTVALLLCVSGARAQLQQPFVYTTSGAIATRNDQTGALAPIAASPLAVLEFPAVIDAKGRFLFAAGNNSIHMFKVDSASGTYSEVPGSPFASANTNNPILIATEPTGTYLGVVNAVGLQLGESSVESFQIDSAGETLMPVSGSFIELVSAPVGAAANPALGIFFVYLGPNLTSSNLFYQQDGDLLTYTIDPQTGLLGDETGAAGSTNHGRSFGADPLGRFVVAGQGQLDGLLQVTSAAGEQGVLNVGSGIYPQEIFAGPGQHFVYATLLSPPSSVVHIYIVDTVNWTLTEAPSSPLPLFTSVSNLVADPTGPFVYQSSAADQVRVYSVDLSMGYLTEVAGSPFTAPGFGLPIALNVVPGTNTQNEVGPVATLTPTSLSLGSSPVGTGAASQAIERNRESDNCAPILVPGNSCFISIVFTPAASGECARHNSTSWITHRAARRLLPLALMELGRLRPPRPSAFPAPR